jgi:RHS repeat-associated protein
MKIGTNYYFYHNDHLGTPQKMTGVNGAVVWSAKYSSFGKSEIDPNSTISNNLRFPGQYEDAESGLYYNYHRYYDLSTGRYLKVDPIGLTGGYNLYDYSIDNPIVNADPFGLSSAVGGGFGITGGIFSVSVSIQTETCCDGEKIHLRTIKSFCWGMQLGFSIRTGESMGPGTASVSIGGNKPGKCQSPKDGQDTYQTENNNFGFSSGVGVGASWSTKDPRATTLTAGQVGFSAHLYSQCNRSVLQDVVRGCCK